MTSRPVHHDDGFAWNGFTSLYLGDMVNLPGEGPLAVRMLGTFGQGSRRSFFCVLGDAERILLGRDNDVVAAYVPTDRPPTRLSAGSVIAEGHSGYLAAHLPQSGSALDVMPWRVLQLYGQLHPLVALYRGPQRLVFLPIGTLDNTTLRTVHLPRNGTETTVGRVAALVDAPPPPIERKPVQDDSVLARGRAFLGRL